MQSDPRSGRARHRVDPVSVDDAIAKLAVSAMLDADVHQGFVVKQMPLDFEDLKRLNGF